MDLQLIYIHFNVNKQTNVTGGNLFISKIVVAVFSWISCYVLLLVIVFSFSNGFHARICHRLLINLLLKMLQRNPLAS